MGEVFLFACFAAVNPTLLAATTVMLVLPSPKRLLVGYLLGAYMTSITLGLVIVFALEGTGTESSARHSLSPIADLAIGAIFLVISYTLGSTRGRTLSERRRERKEQKQAGKEKKEPFAQRLLGRGSAKVAFVVGAALTLPGVSYLTALHRLDKQGLAEPVTVLCVILINLIMLVLIEVPLVGYILAPDNTQVRIDAFKDWIARRGRHFATVATAVIAGVLILRGILELL